MKDAARRCGDIVSSISFGQYHTKLYYSGSRGMHSSFCGGLLTLLLFIPLLVYSSYLLITTLKRDVYSVEEAVSDINKDQLQLNDLTTTILN